MLICKKNEMRPLVIFKMLSHLLAPLILCSNKCGRDLFFPNFFSRLIPVNTKISKFSSYLDKLLLYFLPCPLCIPTSKNVQSLVPSSSFF